MSFTFTKESAQQYEDSPECLPAGKYRVMITEVEDRETKSGTGKYLFIKFQVIEGQYVSWQTTDMLNYENSNEKAQVIGWQQLKKLAKAIWGEFPESFRASDLENKTLIVSTKIDEYNGRHSSKVKNYLSQEAEALTPAPQAMAPAPTAVISVSLKQSEKADVPF